MANITKHIFSITIEYSRKSVVVNSKIKTNDVINANKKSIRFNNLF